MNNLAKTVLAGLAILIGYSTVLLLRMYFPRVALATVFLDFMFLPVQTSLVKTVSDNVEAVTVGLSSTALGGIALAQNKIKTMFTSVKQKATEEVNNMGYSLNEKFSNEYKAMTDQFTALQTSATETQAQLEVAVQKNLDLETHLSTIDTKVDATINNLDSKLNSTIAELDVQAKATTIVISERDELRNQIAPILKAKSYAE